MVGSNQGGLSTNNSRKSPIMGKTVRSKFLFGFLGIIGIGGVTAWFKKNDILRWMFRRTNNKGLKLSAAPTLADNYCVLTSSQAEGPFFISSPIRSDIKEDKKGKEMNLKIQILRMPDCIPIEGVLVELWHCDAEGIYSGYPEDIAHDPWKTLKLIGVRGANVKPMNEARFLRGAQITDANGQVEFNTIFPGWYDPRSPHIHFKVVIDKQEYLTSQFYFEPGFCNRIYLHQEPYKIYGACPYTPQKDFAISKHLQAEGLILNPKWNDNIPLEASAKVGIRKLI